MLFRDVIIVGSRWRQRNFEVDAGSVPHNYDSPNQIFDMYIVFDCYERESRPKQIFQVGKSFLTCEHIIENPATHAIYLLRNGVFCRT